MIKKYKCKYISGGGAEYDGGIWEVKETPKTITFIQVEESFFNPNWNKIIWHKEKERKHCLRDWGDGTYTIYPEQCGTPHIFEPIDEEYYNQAMTRIKEQTQQQTLI